jgi:hypothetical protein
MQPFPFVPMTNPALGIRLFPRSRISRHVFGYDLGRYCCSPADFIRF